MTHSALSTQVTASSSAVEVTVRDPRPDSVQTFEALTPPQQEQLAHDAWHVGLRALMNAYRQAEEARLQDIGKTLTDDLDEQLRQHAELQEKAIATALGRYFDPESGPDPYPIVARLLEALPSGSCLAITHPSGDFDAAAAEGARAVAAQAGVTLLPRPKAEVARFFEGLEMLEPGLVPVPAWRPDADDGVDPRSVYYWAGVGRKP